MRQEVARLVHQVDAQLVVVDADVHVHAADQQTAGDTLHVAGEYVVTLLVGVLLVRPFREGMRRGGHRRQSVAGGDLRDGSAQPGEFAVRLLYVLTDRSADLDLRGEEFRPNQVGDLLLTSIQHAVRQVGDDVAGLPVDEKIFFLDAEREARWLP